MREIKFRAWHKIAEVMLPDEKVNHLRFCIKNENVDLMQFTGLQDAKGVDVYEGDILEFMHHKHKVFRVKGGLVINSHSDDFDKDYTPFYEACADMQTAQWMEQCTITGNIYENKQL